LVETPAGPVPIEAIGVGDMVWSFSVERGESVARRVRAVIRSMAREVRTIRAGARLIGGVTTEHPFYDPMRREYRPVRELQVGDALATLGAMGLVTCAVESVSATELPTRAIEVFNLSIDGAEANYFVEGILVHNKEPVEPACPFDTVTIAEHMDEADAAAQAAEPGDFDVTFKVPAVDGTSSIAIYQGRARLEALHQVEKLTSQHYRVRLESTEPGEYEVVASGHFIVNGQYCGQEQSRFFTIESGEPRDAAGE
jgi:hypothetical protein